KDQETPTASGLLGRWGFNDSCGLVLDSSGNGRNGTLMGLNCTFVAGAPFAANPNAAPVANAGLDQSVTLPASASLIGSYTDDGLSGFPVTTLWTTTSGPGTVTFANATALSTTASFSAQGSYVLQLSANDGALPSTDTATITVNSSAANKGIQFGSNSYVTFGAAPGLGASKFTIETWFRRDGAGIATNTGNGGVVA